MLTVVGSQLGANNKIRNLFMYFFSRGKLLIQLNCSSGQALFRILESPKSIHSDELHWQRLAIGDNFPESSQSAAGGQGGSANPGLLRL
jgi:hypothetical protein